jgi:hypothetical protein
VKEQNQPYFSIILTLALQKRTCYEPLASTHPDTQGSAKILDHLAATHGHLVAEPCEECGNTISTGRNPHTGRSWVCSDHTETCSLHPRNVPRPPGVHHVEDSIGVDGKSRTWIDGVEQTDEGHP